MVAALLLLGNETVDDLVASHFTIASPLWQLEFVDVMVRRHEIPVGCMAARPFAKTSCRIVYFRFLGRLFGSSSQFSTQAVMEPGLCAIAQRRSFLVAMAKRWDVKFRCRLCRGKEEFQRGRGGSTTSREENPTSFLACQKVFYVDHDILPGQMEKVETPNHCIGSV